MELAARPLEFYESSAKLLLLRPRVLRFLSIRFIFFSSKYLKFKFCLNFTGQHAYVNTDTLITKADFIISRNVTDTNQTNIKL
jgi:hypothetical protein